MCDVDSSNDLEKTLKRPPLGAHRCPAPHLPEIEDLNDMLRKFRIFRRVPQNFKAYT
jgi:hypothetical protein